MKASTCFLFPVFKKYGENNLETTINELAP